MSSDLRARTVHALPSACEAKEIDKESRNEHDKAALQWDYDMQEGDPHLFVGPIELAEPTLLLSGDEQSLLWLAGQIESRHMTNLRQGHPEFVVSSGSLT